MSTFFTSLAFILFYFILKKNWILGNNPELGYDTNY